MKMTALLKTLSTDDFNNVSLDEKEVNAIASIGTAIEAVNEETQETEIVDYEVDLETLEALIGKLTEAKKVLKAEAKKADKDAATAKKAELGEIGKAYWKTLANGAVVEYTGKDGKTYKIKRLTSVTENKAGLDACKLGAAAWVDIPSFATHSAKTGKMNNVRVSFDKVVVPADFKEAYLKDKAEKEAIAQQQAELTEQADDSVEAVA